ncbi:RecQ family ATP-dependent DNA helicase [Brachybacterium sp. GCM10030268]|uniref:RecQ family ATP-dependent DNA helicase n=1 Tax=Brachybacterium sp. GCM10030268 TaxID=3273382 RepID=UPI003612458D
MATTTTGETMQESETSVRSTARDVFGLEELREGQDEAMTAVAEGRDVLAVMPSGHGKSAIYQVPAVMRQGTALVISPLVALQADQVEGLEAELGPGRAVAVNSSLPVSRVRAAWDALADGTATFLFLAPEQLAREDTIERLAGAEVSLIAVDEAHCVSAWGHDFRPDYLALGETIRRLGHPAVVALTATASPDTRADIIDRLGMDDPVEVVQSFDRPNLHLAATHHSDPDEQHQAVLEQVASLPGTGLVYTGTRRDTETCAAELAERGLTTAAYHAGRRARDRDAIHEQFLAGELDVVVATSAFGMGIDKPDVRYVVHAQVPGSLDSYYQEIGRAGRDGEPATIHLHYRPEDLGMQRYFAGGAPASEDVRTVFAAIAEHGPIRPAALREHTGLSARAQKRVTNLLEHSGTITVRRDGLRARSGISADEAERAASDQAETREAIDDSRIERIRAYAETTSCRRRALLTYFGEDAEAYCGACDVCESTGAEELQEEQAQRPDDFPAETAVVHREFGRGTVMAAEPDRLTVFFEEVGYRDIALAAIREDEGLLDRSEEGARG